MIHRAEHQEQFVLVTNSALRDKSISLTARGLLAFMLTFADEWSFNFEAIVDQTGAGKNEVRQAIKELKESGYIEIIQEKNPAGKFTKKTYQVFEIGHLNRVTKNRRTVKPNDGKTVCRKNRTSENRTLKNNNIKEYQYKEEQYCKNNKVTHGEFENVLLTTEEHQKLGERLGESSRDELIEQLSCYLRNHPNKYKDHYATILTWARMRSTEKQKPKPAPASENPFTILRRQEGFEI